MTRPRWVRDDYALHDLLLIADGTDIPVETIKQWPYGRAAEADLWAALYCLRASDNPVRVPPRPTWLPLPSGG